MLKYKLKRETIKEKVAFMNSLHSEWKMINLTMKTHKQFKNYSLAQVLSILKSHEDEVMENAKSSVDACPLSLVVKGEVVKERKSKEMVVVNDSKSDATDDIFTSEEKTLMFSNPKKMSQLAS